MNDISAIIYESYKGDIPARFSEMSKKEREDKVRQLIFKELGIEKYEPKTFRRAMREKSAKVYNIIEEVVDQSLADGEFAKDSFFNTFVEVRNLALGDKNEFYVEGKNQLKVSEFSGSHYDLIRRRIDVGHSFSVEVKDFGIRVFEEFDRVASGRADLASLVVLANEAINKKLNELAQSTFVSALNNLPTVNKVTGSYNEKNILKMLAHIEAENGVKPQLVGPALAIRQLQGVTDEQSGSMKDAINNNLILPKWKGYDCVELKQGHKMGTFDFTMEENKIYAVSPDTKLVKLVLEGETTVKDVADYQENADKTIENALAFKAGCAVAYGGLVGLIELS